MANMWENDALKHDEIEWGSFRIVRQSIWWDVAITCHGPCSLTCCCWKPQLPWSRLLFFGLKNTCFLWLNRHFDHVFLPIGSMYGIYANIWGILIVNVTIYSIHGSYGLVNSSILPGPFETSSCADNIFSRDSASLRYQLQDGGPKIWGDLGSFQSFIRQSWYGNGWK